jgi:pseudouridylate synthase
VRFELKTGRTHQIRVHAAKVLGHPVVGDVTYGHKDAKWGLKGQLLHAWKLSFVHPRTGQQMEFTAPLPDYFTRVLDDIEPSALTPSEQE